MLFIRNELNYALMRGQCGGDWRTTKFEERVGWLWPRFVGEIQDCLLGLGPSAACRGPDSVRVASLADVGRAPKACEVTSRSDRGTMPNFTVSGVHTELDSSRPVKTRPRAAFFSPSLGTTEIASFSAGLGRLIYIEGVFKPPGRKWIAGPSGRHVQKRVPVNKPQRTADGGHILSCLSRGDGSYLPGSKPAFDEINVSGAKEDVKQRAEKLPPEL